MANSIKLLETTVAHPSGGFTATGTKDVATGKMGQDVSVLGGVNTTISANEDSIETRKMAMKKIIDKFSSTVTYIGEAALGSSLSASVWRIKRLTVSGTVTITEWAGTGVFDQAWDNHTSLTYN